MGLFWAWQFGHSRKFSIDHLGVSQFEKVFVVHVFQGLSEVILIDRSDRFLLRRVVAEQLP